MAYLDHTPGFPKFNAGCDIIRDLESRGILGPEECPVPDDDYRNTLYWHWSVKRPEELPDWLKRIYERYGEIRW